ncbi:lipopolysaccharide heptosyltransferase I [Noviherbaspirillum pedocola]|uniref:Lipopolysaccharide heptosyltransferase 1 n=1 Tax=Noviherbaspirillum pedocola TaxID=2801341 RepID=A0A934VZT1_9BURK|nr:lipopolysaccharide heptosyltransferase I [Noviherbaspirillum pedocola]MBK4733361.1 lipopolysaccharide heptosyltransferase I [Noviherbaspirillum pedocola]
MNILVVRVSSLGDVVHNMPMVADLRRHVPGATIDWVVEESYTSLVRLNDSVRDVIPFALRRWRRNIASAATRAEMRGFYRALRAKSYDLVLDTQGLFKTGLVMRMARLAPGGRRVGLANATEGSGYEAISRIFHTQSIPVPLRAHAVERARLVAAGALGYRIDSPADFHLAPPQLAPAWLPQEPYAVFFHGTARAAKGWAPARWIALGRSLAERGLIVLLPWGSAVERAAAEALAVAIPGARVLPSLPLMEAVLLAQRASLAVGVDTGLTHIAAAYNRPTIEIYCDSPRWKTEGNWSNAIINLGEIGAPPEVREVQAAAFSLLDRQPA